MGSTYSVSGRRYRVVDVRLGDVLDVSLRKLDIERPDERREDEERFVRRHVLTEAKTRTTYGSRSALSCLERNRTKRKY